MGWSCWICMSSRFGFGHTSSLYFRCSLSAQSVRTYLGPANPPSGQWGTRICPLFFVCLSWVSVSSLMNRVASISPRWQTGRRRYLRTRWLLYHRCRSVCISKDIAADSDTLWVSIMMVALLSGSAWLAIS